MWRKLTHSARSSKAFLLGLVVLLLLGSCVMRVSSQGGGSLGLVLTPDSGPGGITVGVNLNITQDLSDEGLQGYAFMYHGLTYALVWDVGNQTNPPDLETVRNSTWQVIGYAHINNSAWLNGTATIPSNATVGDHLICAIYYDQSSDAPLTYWWGYFNVIAPPPVTPGCVIATATYGSALAPQVQALRDFRENIALKTFAGSSFMAVFNEWYYSWSPPVAATIAPSDSIRAVMRVALQPILNILQVTTYVNSAFSFNAEFAIFMAGFVAAALIGLVYIVPIATLALFIASRLKKSWNLPKVSVLKYIAIPWLISIALIAAAELALLPVLMMAATGAFVVLTIAVVVGVFSLQINRTLKRH